jgi:hypothetical protein
MLYKTFHNLNPLPFSGEWFSLIPDIKGRILFIYLAATELADDVTVLRCNSEDKDLIPDCRHD